MVKHVIQTKNQVAISVDVNKNLCVCDCECSKERKFEYLKNCTCIKSAFVDGRWWINHKLSTSINDQIIA